MYWVELPLAALLTACLFYNRYADGFMKLYPLIIALTVGMAVILVYYFRGIRISYDEIRYIGLFTSRDSAVITEGKTLIIKELPHGKLEITLFGNDGVLPELDWVKSTGDAPRDISLFRGKTIGRRRTVAKVMSYFGVPKDEAADLLLQDSFSSVYPIAEVSGEVQDGKMTVRIKITKTV